MPQPRAKLMLFRPACGVKSAIMKQATLVLLTFCMIGLCGCPLLTKNSVDNGSYDVPSWLPGTWCEIDKDGAKKNCYLLENGNKKGVLTCYDITTAAGKADRTKPVPVILSSIGGKVYMSVYTPPDDMSQEGYYLFELHRKSDKEFELDGVKENAIGYDAEAKDIMALLKKGSTEIIDPNEVSRYKKQ